MGLFLSYNYAELGPNRLEEIREKLNNFAGFQGAALLEETVNRVLDASIEVAKIYPPEVPGSTYRRGWGAFNRNTGRLWGQKRSGNLGEHWQKTVYAGNDVVVGIMFNNVTDSYGRPYASFVMGKGTQAAIHIGVWNTAEDIVDAILGLRKSNQNVTVTRMKSNEWRRLEDKIDALLK